jgi:hypothetical protein
MRSASQKVNFVQPPRQDASAPWTSATIKKAVHDIVLEQIRNRLARCAARHLPGLVLEPLARPLMSRPNRQGRDPNRGVPAASRTATLSFSTDAPLAEPSKADPWRDFDPRRAECGFVSTASSSLYWQKTQAAVPDPRQKRSRPCSREPVSTCQSGRHRPFSGIRQHSPQSGSCAQPRYG